MAASSKTVSTSSRQPQDKFKRDAKRKRWTYEVKPRSKENGQSQKGKKKKDFGFSDKRHGEMLTKIATVISVPDVSLFDQKIMELRLQLLQYMNYPLIPPEQAYFLIHLTGRIAQVSVNPNVFSILSSFCTSVFLREQLSVHFMTWRKEKSTKELTEIALSCLMTFERTLRSFPTSLQEVQFVDLRKLIQYLKDEALSERLDTIEEVRYEYGKSISTHYVPPTYSVGNKASFDFRQLSTIPTEEDVTLPAPTDSLRPVVKYGPYPSGEEYLDITFRLLREDLISPLRDLVKDFQTPSKRRSVTSFEHVRVLYPICTHRGITYRVSFDVAKYRGFPWDNSKKLIFGSLLCFSKDNFQTMLFGTVSNRETFLLRKGELDVRFGSNEQLHSYVRDGRMELTMLECPSFFEAYRHAMDCFKDLNPYKISMQRYIIECNPDLRPPKYLRDQPSARYDLTECFGVTKEANKKLYSVCKTIPIIGNKEWSFPTLLNQSQMDAVKHALTSEFALIQGPPGTGKTFCGLRIAHALLVNKGYWNKEGDTPMIIVAYTNHALDQFLTGLAEYGHKNILRVGSRYAENLEPFSMQVAKDKFRTRMNRSNSHRHLRYMKSILFESRDQFAYELGPYMMSAKKTQEAIKRGKLVTFKELWTCMEQRHSSFFLEHDQYCIKLQISIFDIFLQLCKIPTSILNNVSRKHKGNDNNNNSNKASQQRSSHSMHHESYLYHRHLPDNENPADTINIVGEGNALTERWVIDENEFKPAYNTTGDPSNPTTSPEDELADDACFMDENGFQLVTLSRWEKQRKVRTELCKVEPMSCADVRTVHNPWDLPISERWRLYKYWLGLYMRSYDDEIEMLMQQYEDTCAQATQVQEREQELIFKSKDVVAMTTSCASRYRNVLERMKPKIVIIEEAAEVMEAHVISSLLTSTEHCILIGDHKQLRPNPSVYELATKYGLELSLFERMVENHVKCLTLNVQHRMCPEISHQLRHIYPGLQNHISVAGYPDVFGVAKNLFFLNHSEPETCDYRLNSSKSNKHEARFLQALCFYFLQQGYQPGQITVLTGYSGQLMQLKNVMPKDLFEGVKVTSVDNFQGEENDIILLSLVRSNQRKSIGFLKTENRICVALSRAKQGMFVIGNFDLLESECSIWRSIINDVKAQGCFGEAMTLVCQNHPHTSVEVATEEDFEQVPKGGCMLLCDYALPCLHFCKSHCHPHDRNHEFYECEEICVQKVCSNPEHSCGRQCHFGEDCGPCQVQIKTMFPCGHTQYLSCSLNTTQAVCQEPCSSQLSCGHTCGNVCGQPCIDAKECQETVEKSLPCGHKRGIACSTQPKDACCDAECTITLHCGHTCNGDCTKCNRGKLHVSCGQTCGRAFACGHICNGPCSHACFGCEEDCYMECEHSECDQDCSKECKQCKETCTRSCPHQTCSKNCDQPCDIEPCSKPCELLLPKCQHCCLGLCGEECPELCRLCNRGSSVFLGLPRKTRFIVLQDCDHVFEVSKIDELFEKTPNEVFAKSCPSCQTPIVNTPRYKHHVIQMKTDLRNIELFYRQHDKVFVQKLKRLVYASCHATTSGLHCDLSKKDTLYQYYQMIVQSASLEQFEASLDLKYLARQQASKVSKPDVLLIAERLLQCVSSTDVIRLYNQMQILKYVHEIIQRVNSDIGTLDGQMRRILLKLTLVPRGVMSPTLSVQQAKDLLLEIDCIVLEILCMYFRSKVRKRIQNKDYNYASMEEHKESDVTLTGLLKEFRGPNTVLGQVDVDKLFNFLEKARQHLSLRPVNINRCALRTENPLTNEHVWFRCHQKHLYACADDTTADHVQCPKCEPDVDCLTKRLHDLSLTASNNEYDTEDSFDDGESQTPSPAGDSGYISSTNKKVEPEKKNKSRSRNRSRRRRSSKKEKQPV